MPPDTSARRLHARGRTFLSSISRVPTDYQRWTIDGLKGLLSEFEIVSIGIRTGPTATMLTFVLEFVKVLSPGPLKRPARAICAWIIWPFRYLDLWLNRRPDAYVLANHIYA